ncbi:hypothetical protein TNCT_196411 [Trichonephila clavata]|uniref:Uncharacterized protein n=1 Tax=Trichonephila clavata TaxID=2740835 RepID=A0A8X6IN30_TRICU|nr:hypothetical protein TNCT_196411 [Trichonephila clavata]
MQNLRIQEDSLVSATKSRMDALNSNLEMNRSRREIMNSRVYEPSLYSEVVETDGRYSRVRDIIQSVLTHENLLDVCDRRNRRQILEESEYKVKIHKASIAEGDAKRSCKLSDKKNILEPVKSISVDTPLKKNGLSFNN